MKTVGQVIQEGKEQFIKAKLPDIEARYLAEYVLEKTFTEIVNDYESIVTQEELNQYRKLIRERLDGVPLQHLTNSQHFYGMDFYVNEHVLIPRPETELLVEESIKYIDRNIDLEQVNTKKTVKILDLCTGSGCILISILKHFQDMELPVEIDAYGVDISENALEVAKINEKHLLKNKKINWIESDLFNKVTAREFDLIVSNPPYIAPKDIEMLMSEVKDYEPRLALDGGEDGYKFYREIISHGKEYLTNGGLLIFEIGHGQMKTVKKLMIDNDYKGVDAMNDLANLERIVYGTRELKPD